MDVNDFDNEYDNVKNHINLKTTVQRMTLTALHLK